MKKKLEIEMEWFLNKCNELKTLSYIDERTFCFVRPDWGKQELRLFKFLGSKPCKVRVVFVKDTNKCQKQ